MDVVQKSPVTWRIGERRMKDLPAAFDVEPAKRCDRPCCHSTLTTNATSVSLNAAGSTTSLVLGHLITRVENPALSTLVISEYDPLLSGSFFSRARITRTYGPPAKTSNSVSPTNRLHIRKSPGLKFETRSWVQGEDGRNCIPPREQAVECSGQRVLNG